MPEQQEGTTYSVSATVTILGAKSEQDDSRGFKKENLLEIQS